MIYVAVVIMAVLAVISALASPEKEAYKPDESDMIGDAGRIDGVELGNGSKRRISNIQHGISNVQVKNGKILGWEYYRGTPLRWWEVVIGAVILAVIVAGFWWAGMGAI